MNLGDTFETAESRCLICGNLLDAATAVETDRQPHSGSLGICGYCGAVSAYDAELRLRPLTDAEAAEIVADPVLLMQIELVTGAIRFVMDAKN